jgi:dynein heavy chain
LKRKVALSTTVLDEFLGDDDLDSEALAEKMHDIIDRLTTIFYRLVSVALFSHHKLMFSFMLCASIMRARSKRQTTAINVASQPQREDSAAEMGTTLSDGKSNSENQRSASADRDKDTVSFDTEETISALEWQIFLQGEFLASTFTSTKQGQGHEEWAGRPARWKQCEYIDATLPAFHGLCNSLRGSPDQWLALQLADDPYHLMATPPTGNESADAFDWSTLSSFQRLLLINVLCRSRLIGAVRWFVEEHMGAQFVATGNVDLAEMYDESEARTPLIFILSSGESRTSNKNYCPLAN